ncbi:MAG TPA: hypothetical protein VF775_06275 [Geobacteraceae bacterium]
MIAGRTEDHLVEITPPGIPHRDEIVTVAFAVVAFSIFAQGLTITSLLRRLGELPSDGD